jgi:hypothetical protein
VTISLEKATRALLGRERKRADEDEDRREYGHKPKITLAPVRFLERELPPWWNEIPPKPKSAGRRKTAE